jgi:hypothetical protein
VATALDDPILYPDNGEDPAFRYLIKVEDDAGS